MKAVKAIPRLLPKEGAEVLEGVLNNTKKVLISTQGEGEELRFLIFELPTRCDLRYLVGSRLPVILDLESYKLVDIRWRVFLPTENLAVYPPKNLQDRFSIV